MMFATDLPDPDATEALALRLLPMLGAGDVITLSGPLGAGKTAFARCLIQGRARACGVPVEPVPSPSFTLVQVYEAPGRGPGCDYPIWHVDLYRLDSPDEILELGLEEALSTALCLIEWPERMGAALPADRLEMILEPGQGDRRHVRLSGFGPRGRALEAFLAGGDP